MKALVISGGGSKGAYAGGIMEYLTGEQQKSYDIYAGSSVGALIITQVALNKLAGLKEVFGKLTNKDIFNIFPFRVKNKNGKRILSINHFNTLKAFMKGSATFGESKNLRKLIEKMLSKDEFEYIKHQSQLSIAVSNLTKQKIEYINAADCTYKDFCDWIWASANVTPFMSLLNKNNCQFADGGFGTYLPVLNAIENGATEIEAIILNKEEKPEVELAANPFQSLMGVFKFMANQIELKDILIGKLHGREAQIDIKLWYPPENLTNNAIYFDGNEMAKWWQMGYEFAKNNQPVCYCFLPDGQLIDMKM